MVVQAEVGVGVKDVDSRNESFLDVLLKCPFSLLCDAFRYYMSVHYVSASTAETIKEEEKYSFYPLSVNPPPNTFQRARTQQSVLSY